jgi:hypothetical protein
MEDQIKTNPTVKNPNEVLADIIFQKLLEAGLISEDGKSDFIKNLSQGQLKDGLWRITLEQNIKSKSSTDETSET